MRNVLRKSTKWANIKTYEQTFKKTNTALTINPEVYYNKEYFEEERSKLFKRGWVPIGYTNQFDNKNNIIPSQINNIPIVMTKNKKGEINAFQNVCRHRGSKLVDDEKKGSVMACPYHKWTYDLDGNLRGTPLFKPDEAIFKKEDYPLFNINVEINNNIIFGNMEEGKIKPPSETMGNAFKLLNEYPLKKCKIVKSKEYRVKANWKLLIDNFIEYYHLPAVHPELVKGSGMDEHICTQESGDYISFKTDPITSSGLPIDIEKNPPFSTINYYKKDTGFQNNTQIAHFHALYPNIFYFLFPNHIFSVIVHPISPTESIEKAVLMVENDRFISDKWVNDLFNFYDRVNTEDLEICEKVQEGIQCDSYMGGRMVPKYEGTIHRFHKYIIEQMVD